MQANERDEHVRYAWDMLASRSHPRYLASRAGRKCSDLERWPFIHAILVFFLLSAPSNILSYRNYSWTTIPSLLCERSSVTMCPPRFAEAFSDLWPGRDVNGFFIAHSLFPISSDRQTKHGDSAQDQRPATELNSLSVCLCVFHYVCLLCVNVVHIVVFYQCRYSIIVSFDFFLALRFVNFLHIRRNVIHILYIK